MVELIKALSNISLQKPPRSFPGLPDFTEGCMTSPIRTEPVRAGAHLRFIVCLQDESHDFLEEFIRPGRQAQRAKFAIPFWDENPLYWCPSVAFIAQIINDRLNFLDGHSVYCLFGTSWRHGSIIGIQTPIGPQIQIWIVQLSIDVL